MAWSVSITYFYVAEKRTGVTEKGYWLFIEYLRSWMAKGLERLQLNNQFSTPCKD